VIEAGFGLSAEIDCTVQRSAAEAATASGAPD